MSEEALRDILEKAVLIEYADNDDLLEHKFSLKHRSAMKRIFAKYEKSTQRTREKQRIACDKKRHISVRKRVFITAVIVLLMAFLTGCVTVYFSEKFSGIVYPGNTSLRGGNRGLSDCYRI